MCVYYSSVTITDPLLVQRWPFVTVKSMNVLARAPSAGKTYFVTTNGVELRISAQEIED